MENTEITVENYKYVLGNIKARLTRTITAVNKALNERQGRGLELTTIELQSSFDESLRVYSEAKARLQAVLKTAPEILIANLSFIDAVENTSNILDESIEGCVNFLKSLTLPPDLTIQLPDTYIVSIDKQCIETNEVQSNLPPDYAVLLKDLFTQLTEQIKDNSHLLEEQMAEMLEKKINAQGIEFERQIEQKFDLVTKQVDQLRTIVIHSTTGQQTRPIMTPIVLGQNSNPHPLLDPSICNPTTVCMPTDISKGHGSCDFGIPDFARDGRDHYMVDQTTGSWVLKTTDHTASIPRSTSIASSNHYSEHTVRFNNGNPHTVSNPPFSSYEAPFNKETPVHMEKQSESVDTAKPVSDTDDTLSQFVNKLSTQLLAGITQIISQKNTESPYKVSRVVPPQMDFPPKKQYYQYATDSENMGHGNEDKYFQPKREHSTHHQPGFAAAVVGNGGNGSPGMDNSDFRRPRYPTRRGQNNERRTPPQHPEYHDYRYDQHEPDATEIVVQKLNDLSARQILPTMPITKFNGKSEQWLSFYLDFSDLVANKSFSSHEKFNYLIAFLEDQPKQLVQGMRGTPHEFNDAWAELEFYYGDPRALSGDISAKLKTGPPIKGDKELLFFHQELVSNIRTLRRFGQFELLGNWEALGCMASRLPRELQNKWKREVRKIRDRNPGAQESLNDFVKLIGDEARAMNIPVGIRTSTTSSKSVEVPKSTSRSYVKKTIVPSPKLSHKTLLTQSGNTNEDEDQVLSDEEQSDPLINDNFKCLMTQLSKQLSKTTNMKDRRTTGASSGSEKTKSRRHKKCPICSDIHKTMLKCKTFMDLELTARRNLARELNFCYLCLSYEHVVGHCQSEKLCDICSKKHHSSLHDTMSINPTVTVSRLTSSATPTSAMTSSSTTVTSNKLKSSSTTPGAGKTSKLVAFSDNECEYGYEAQSSSDEHSVLSDLCLKTSNNNKNYLCSFNVIPIKVTGVKATKVLYAVLDSASTTSYVDVDVAETIGCIRNFQTQTVSTLNQEQPVRVGLLDCELDTALPGFRVSQSCLPLKDIVLKTVEGLSASFDHPWPWNSGEEHYFSELGVDKPSFPDDQHVSMLIGQDIYVAHQVYGYRPNEPEPYQHRLVKTMFGWYRNAPPKTLMRLIRDRATNVRFNVNRIIKSSNYEPELLCAPAEDNNQYIADSERCIDKCNALRDVPKELQMYFSIVSTDNEFDDQLSLHKEELTSQVDRAFSIDTPECGSWDKTPGVLEKRAEHILQTTTHLLPNQHYETSMLWRNDTPHLNNNRNVAYRQAMSLRKKLLGDEVLKNYYLTQIGDYLQKGYLIRVPEHKKTTSKTNYLPHHAVTHKDKPGKVRVVNNASSRFKGKSLNDALLGGPNIINYLYGILLRFRQHKVAWNADIEAMFHQVYVPVEDRDALRFLWWDNDDLEGEPIDYWFTVHVFGKLDSPCVVINAVNQCGHDFGDDYNKDVEITIKRDMYVDDCLRSGDQLKHEIEVAIGLIGCLARGGFNLKKFCSNSTEFLKHIPADLRIAQDNDLIVELIPESKSLGLGWNPNTDELYIRWKQWKTPEHWTKRSILSLLASFFDPIGFISPVVLVARMLFQELWKLKLDWDDPVTNQALIQEWTQWLREIEQVPSVRIPRWYFSVLVTDPKYQIHAFSDASEKAIGVVLYLRRETSDGQVDVSFLTSKARVIGSQAYLSIPRAELLAATLSSELACEVQHQLTFVTENIYWTDARLVLVTLHSKQNLKTYVANRRAQILDRSTIQQWHWCPGDQNPADIASRGCGVEKLVQSSMWFSGPEFLQNTSEQWPTLPEFTPQDEKDLEIKTQKMSNKKSTTYVDEDRGAVKTLKVGDVVTVTDNYVFRQIKKKDTWDKAVRLLATCKKIALIWLERSRTSSKLRQSRRLQKLEPVNSKIPVWSISRDEFDKSEYELLRLYQEEAYPHEYACLHDGSGISRKSSLNKLSLFMEDGVIRLRTRLQDGQFTYEYKNPCLVPPGTAQEQMVLGQHLAYLHAGRSLISASLRQRFWLHRPTKVYRRIVRDCIPCRKSNAHLLKQRMADLPQDRLKAFQTPFTNVGLDLWGPCNVVIHRSTVKRWGLIFTCLSCRAVHLERVTGSDTNSFILALRRFTSRRGEIKHIFCDSATNFHGASNQIQRWCANWNHQQINDHLKQSHIEWNFNTPTAKWRGGIWEREIGSIKRCFERIVPQTAKLTDDQFYTVLTEIEAMLNSRPLTISYDDPDAPLAITPAHILGTKPFIPIPRDDNLTDSAFNSTLHWKRTQRVADIFWDQWQRSYISRLSLAHKWLGTGENLKIGDFVLLQGENIPRKHWVPAVVVDVIADNNGLVRTAHVKTTTGSILERPIQRLVMLEESQPTTPELRVAGVEPTAKLAIATKKHGPKNPNKWTTSLRKLYFGDIGVRSNSVKRN